MRIVVTGATSFIGVPLIQALLDGGHEVCAVVRPGSHNLNRLDAGRSDLTVLPLELGQADQLERHVAGTYDIFFHFGWDGPGSSNRTDREVQQRNVRDSLRALRGAAALGCRKFLFSGSQAEYGICSRTMTEETPCAPVSEYGKAKVEFYRQACEEVRRLWEEEGRGIEYIHTRIFSIYGPGDHPWSLVESCLEAFARGQTIGLGDCTQLWNFLYIDDLVGALLALMDSWERDGTVGLVSVYNIAGEESQTRPLQEYVKEMYALCGQKGGYCLGKRPPNAEGAANLIPDISKIVSRTGWRPAVSFQEGIRRMLALRAERPQPEEGPQRGKT